MEYKRIDDCFCKIQNGVNIRQGEKDGGYPITRIETISNNKFNRDKMGYAGIDDIEKYKNFILEDGDILMSHINSVQYLGRAVKYIKAKDNEKIIHGMNLLCLKAKKDILNPSYAEYFFRSNCFRQQISCIAKKSVNQASFTVSDLKKLKIKLYDINKQTYIAETLNKIRVVLDLKLLQVRKLDTLIKARFVEMFGVPLSNEKGWPLKRIGDLFGLISRGNQPSYVAHSSVQVINQACVYWERFNLENVKYHDSQSVKKTLPIKKNYILINSTGTGTLGRCNVFPELTDNNTYVADSHVTVLAENHDINSYFFKCFLQREDVQKKIYAECVNGSTNQIELSKEKLSNVLIIVPPIELQEQFAAFVRQVDKSKVSDFEKV